MDMLRFLKWILFLAVIAVLPGCTASQTCTLIGCGDSLVVNFTGATDKAGHYRIDIVADGEASSCEITLPWDCNNTQRSCTREDLRWRLTASGGCGGVAHQTIDAIAFYNAAPLTVDVVVRRDDIAVGEGTANPQYTESRPNGPDCEPVCRSAPPLVIAVAP